MTATFSSRWGLLLATLGMAIGTGNLWRFPRILAQNGGGTFLIPWALFLFAWSIPLLMVEFALGRAARRGPVGAFARVFGPHTAWRGGFVALCTLGIMFYYSVVSGWTLRYLCLALGGGLDAVEPANAVGFFVDFTETGWPVLFHLVSIGLCCWVVGAGVTSGIERACRVLVPALFGVLVLAAVRGLTLEGSGAGLDFLTHVEWGRLADHEIWLEALSQSAWSTGAGWGLMICYAIYAGSGMRARRECVTTGAGNNLASLLAALAIIPAVFALAPAAGVDAAALVREPGPANTGLTFIWMPVLFRHMPWGGGVLSSLFFLALAFAALSSLIAMVELGVRTLVDLGLSRRAATAATFAAGFGLGLPSALSLSVFENQDWVWGVGLIVSGGVLALSVLGYGVTRFWKDHVLGPEGGSGRGRAFRLAVGLLIPIQFVGLLAWWFHEAWTWTDADAATGARLVQWLDPAQKFSLGTCLVQWLVVMALLVLFNRRLGQRSAH